MHPFYQVDEFNPDISIGYLLRRLHRISVSQTEKAFDGSDVTFTQWIALALLSHGLAGTCSTLSRDMGYDTGAMTRLVDQLEERGLVMRGRSESDRRVRKLTVTPEGDEMLHALVGKVVGVWNEILDGVDHDEVSQLIATLTKLVGRAEALETEQGAVA
jgi:DNA-binding MarR family transcriptional regulator